MSPRSERLGFRREELRARTARGGVLNALFMGGAESLVLIQGLVVTALLGPHSIGLYGVVSTTAVTLIALQRIGIDEAFVAQEVEDQEAEFQRAFTVACGIAAIASLLIAVAAPILAAVYGDHRLLWLTLAVCYLPVGFALQAPQWIFFRRMDFLRVRVLQAMIPVLTFCVAVPLAATGFGVWSLVVGPLVGNTASVLTGLAISPYRLRLRFDRSAWQRYLRFSWPVFTSSLALLIIAQAQITAFGLHGGLVAAGYITLAATLTRYADRADQILATTIYPAICAVRDRTETLTELFVKSNRLTLMWVLPFAGTFMLFSADLTARVLGHRWQPATVLLVGLAAALAIQQLGYNWFSFYRAQGRSWPQAVEASAMVGAFGLLAIPGLLIWGTWGFIVGRALTSVAMLAVRWRYIHRLLPRISLPAIAAPASAVALLAAVPVLIVRAVLWGGHRPLLQIAAELALWCGGLAVWGWRLERPLLGEVRGYLRPGLSARSRSAGAAAPAPDAGMPPGAPLPADTSHSW